MLKVYLAGGMKSNWQSIIIEKLQNHFIFFNPQEHQLNKANEYTVWDLHFVNQSDIIFAYIDSGNPSGIGLSLEIGYAKALNKTIILIDEKSVVDMIFSQYFMIVRNSASIVFDNLASGIDYLEKFSINTRNKTI